MSDALECAASAALVAYRAARALLVGPGWEPTTGEGWQIIGDLCGACGCLNQAGTNRARWRRHGRGAGGVVGELVELVEIAERAADAAYRAELQSVCATLSRMGVPGESRTGEDLRELARAREYLARARRLVRRMDRFEARLEETPPEGGGVRRQQRR